MRVRGYGHDYRFSAALCRGLIEAGSRRPSPELRPGCFPRLYAAASLKHVRRGRRIEIESAFSAALCRGLIEAWEGPHPPEAPSPFSAALCRGLIEAPNPKGAARSRHARFPRLYAAASLKRGSTRASPRRAGSFSAALCRGLIEAGPWPAWRSCWPAVFRGFMPRPH